MLRVIHNLGGCGGTLLSRCLGALPHVAILSEINPLSVDFFPELNPLYQDRKWLHLLSEEEIAHFSGVDLGEPVHFQAIITALQTRAEERGRILILRDYNYADHIGVPFLPSPPRRRVLYDALTGFGPVAAIAVVRHPVDQWASLRKHVTVRRGALSPSEFGSAYAAFAEGLGSTPVFRYEDLAANPEKELRKICECLQVPFDAGFRQAFHRTDTVTGNLERQADTTISIKPQTAVAEEFLDDFQANPALSRAAIGWGYTEVRTGRLFSNPTAGGVCSIASLQAQVAQLRQGAVEWISEIKAKDEQIRAKDQEIREVHAEAEQRGLELERAVATIREMERALSNSSGTREPPWRRFRWLPFLHP